MRNLKFLLVVVSIVFFSFVESSDNNFKKLQIEKKSDDRFFEDVNYKEKDNFYSKDNAKCPKDETNDESKNTECPEDETNDESKNTECPEDESEDESKNTECPEDETNDESKNTECPEDKADDESEKTECPEEESNDESNNPECPKDESNDESEKVECPKDETNDESEKTECPEDKTDDESNNPECPEDEVKDESENTECPEDEVKDESETTECPEDSEEETENKQQSEIPKGLELKAIVIVGNEKILKLRDFEDEEGVFFEGSGNKRLLKEKLSKYLSKPFPQKEGIVEIKKEIIKYYKNQNMPLVIVNVPPQDITDGILRFVVTEAKLGKVKVIGNKYFRAHQYKNKISLKKGDCIDEKVLLKNINFLNKNPYRKVDMIYTPGEKQYTTDIELLTHENRPFRVYYGSENTGLDLTGKNRYLAGISVGNLFRLGHIFSYQITRSFETHRFQAHTFQYTLPLWWQHRILLYGGFSDVKAELPTFKTSRNKGDSYQGSLRYEAPLNPFNLFTHDFTFGFDFKRTNNSLSFAENLPRYGSYVNLTQAMAGYSLKCLKGIYQSSVDLEIFCSPTRWVSDQSTRAYKTIRPHARNKYVYGILKWQNLVNMYKNFNFSFFSKIQLSSTNLLPSEQMGIGGYYSVRGFDEHEYNLDNGVVLSSEMTLPPFGVIRYLCEKKIKDSIQLLGFIDYGFGWPHRRVKGEARSRYLLGAGPGIRYVIENFLSVRLDWGYRLHKKRGSKLHFGVMINY